MVGLLNVHFIGVFEFFGIVFILYECSSVLKNMVLCELPIPLKIKRVIEKILADNISEGGDKIE